MAFRPRLPTATESNCIRSLYSRLRQVRERSCVHPLLLPLVFQASRQREGDQNGPAALNYLRWQSGRSLPAGGGRCRRGEQMSATTCELTPGRAARTSRPRAETFMTPRTGGRHQSPAPGPPAAPQPRRPAAWRGLAAPTGSRSTGAEQEVSGVALILDAWTSVTGSRTSVRPRMLPLSPLRPRSHERRAIWLEIQRDGPCRGNVRWFWVWFYGRWCVYEARLSRGRICSKQFINPWQDGFSRWKTTLLTKGRRCYFGTISHNLKTMMLYCLSSSFVVSFHPLQRKSVTITFFKIEKWESVPICFLTICSKTASMPNEMKMFAKVLLISAMYKLL